MASEAEEKEMDPPDSASRVFCGRFLSMVNTDDVNAIILAQKNMLDRFEKTNEMLLNFNNLSSVRLQQMSERFLHHTRTLVDMKRDLDSIFRRIRTLKGKLARQHPEAFSQLCLSLPYRMTDGHAHSESASLWNSMRCLLPSRASVSSSVKWAESCPHGWESVLGATLTGRPGSGT
uniref:kxDL motif-containing protein 1 isoform X3 n=1 Tax=Myodes glareolus TaxID=447135 RepID=UPI002021CE8B|nr:kxDL motif-containing protein 1 isoform X3 [Myodes glareolus]